MTVSGTNLLQALASKMRWHQERQQLLAQNIANADTPGYTEKDLKPFEIDDGGSGIQSVAMVTSSDSTPTSFSVSSGDESGGFELQSGPSSTNPIGNDVTIEDEMMKVSSNDLDYQTVTALYSRQLGLVRIALGKEA